MACNLCNDEAVIEQTVPHFDNDGNEVGVHAELVPCPYLNEPAHRSAECQHCEHYHDWSMAEGQEEPYGDPGDGLGAQGVCCECGMERAS